jgi:predicted DNA-binding transcriptional regulator AlpA
MDNNTTPINPKNLLTIAAFAKSKGVKRQTVYNWIKEEKVKKVEFLTKTFVDISTYQD